MSLLVLMFTFEMFRVGNPGGSPVLVICVGSRGLCVVTSPPVGCSLDDVNVCGLDCVPASCLNLAGRSNGRLVDSWDDQLKLSGCRGRLVVFDCTVAGNWPVDWVKVAVWGVVVVVVVVDGERVVGVEGPGWGCTSPSHGIVEKGNTSTGDVEVNSSSET